MAHAKKCCRNCGGPLQRSFGDATVEITEMVLRFALQVGFVIGSVWLASLMLPDGCIG